MSPNILFNRLLLVVKLQSERTQYFDYPLTPEPAALFIDGQMRQANKSTLKNNFLKMENRKEDPDSDVCVIDGGDLLHKTLWVNQSTYADIAYGYVKYINKYFDRSTTFVVFDGYQHANSTKNHAQIRRENGKQAATFTFKSPGMVFFGRKEEFLKKKKKQGKYDTHNK